MIISIVIPIHNEENNLLILLPDLINELKLIHNVEFEVILIDDFSTDKSYEVCKKFIDKKKKSIFIKLIKLEKRSGQTGAFKTAFKIAKGDYIITMDADLQDEPKDIIKFLRKIRTGYDLVIGYRMKRKSSLFLRFSIAIYDLLISFFVHSNLKSYRAQFIAYNSAYLKNLPWYKNDHRYLIPIVIHRGINKYIEIDLEHKPRRFGSSKYHQFSKIFFGIPEVLVFLFKLNLKYYD